MVLHIGIIGICICMLSSSASRVPPVEKICSLLWLYGINIKVGTDEN